MPRTPFLAGNWKMNCTIAESKALVNAVLPELDAIKGADRVLCPPFTALATVSELLAGSSVKAGAQNMHFQDRGAFTGEISAAMIKELAEYVIIGHSERRIHFADKDYQVGLKMAAALKAGLKPILCVGENADQKENEWTESVLAGQVLSALRDLSPSADIIVAYEPVWAIGTGAPAQPEEAQHACGFIREQIAGRLGDEAAARTRILYGGSVTAKNITDFIGQADVDGALVGTAALRADEWIALVKAGAEAAGAKS